MRIPLFRFGRDDRPLAAWEYAFLPSAAVGIVLYLSLASILAVLVGPILMPLVAVLSIRDERRLRRRLASCGRFIDWSSLEAKLKQGEGTLIMHHESPYGPLRIWWTEQDLLSPL